MKTPCPTMGKHLTAYVFGEITRKHAEALRVHLETCEACRAEVIALSAARDEVRSVLLADTEAPAALSPERLAAVLATPPSQPSAKRRSAAGTPCATSPKRVRGPWRKVVFAAKVAACLVLFLGILSATLFPAGSQSAHKAKVQAARARVAAFASDMTYCELIPCSPSRIDAAEMLMRGTPHAGDRERNISLSPPPVKSRPSSPLDASPPVSRPPSDSPVAAEVSSKDVVRRKTDASGGRNSGGPSSAPLVERPRQELQRATQPEHTEADGRSLVGNQQSGTERVPINIQYPKPQFTGTPKAIKGALNLESPEDAAKRWGERLSIEREGDVPAPPGLARSEKLKENVGAIAHRVETRGRALDTAGQPLSEENTARRSRMLGEANVDGNALRIALEALEPSGDYIEVNMVFADEEQDDLRETQLLAMAKSVNKAWSPSIPQVSVNPFVKTAAEPLSTFAIGTDTASYTLTRQSLGNGMLPDPAVVRVEEFVNALDYKDTAPERTTFRIIAEGAPSPFGRNTQLVRLAIKGKRLGREEQRPANLVFLVDASGSMAQPDRMGAIQLALGQLLQGLRPEDRLQIVTFNEKARLVQSQTSAANHQEIMANFKRVQATGPTSLQDGMVMAYQQAVATFQPGAENRVILITDGIANLGSSEASDILAEIDACRRQGIRLSVFGVGRGTYNDTLLQQLANKGDGSYRFLDSPDAITDAFVNDLSATLYTIASDAKVQVEWFPHAVAEYRQLGYEARALTAEQFRDDTVVAGQIGSGQTASALYEISLARTRALPPNAELGIVRIRFRPSDGGAVQEISRPILKSDLAESFAKARPEFQFAAVASGFAERLHHSPYAPTQSYRDLANLLRPAAQQLYLDTRFAELVHLLDTAAAITR